MEPAQPTIYDHTVARSRMPRQLGMNLGQLRVATLRWAIGGFCLAIGALMCVVPHQFSSPAFALIRAYLPWVGNIYLAAGAALIGVAALRPRRSLTMAGHAAAGGALLFYALMFLSTAAWGAWPLYLALSLGTIGAGLLPSDRDRPASERGGDLFAIVMGICAVSVGLVMLLLPGQFQLSIYDLLRPYLRWFGVVFIGSGGLLVLVHLRLGQPRPLYWPAHVLIAGAFFVYMALVSVPNRGISGIAFYGGFGLLLALLPRLGPALGRMDARSLQIRQALILAATAAIPLTLTVTIITDQQERIALDRALDEQQVLATLAAQNISDDVLYHRGAVAALAAGLADTSDAAAQERQLGQLQAAYAEILACATFDAAGARIAGGNDAVLVPDAAAGPRATQPTVALSRSAAGQPPVLVISAPIGSAERFGGVVTCELMLPSFETHMGPVVSLQNYDIYAVDEAGREIARVGAKPGTPPEDRSQTPAVLALRAAGAPGALQYGQGAEVELSGYAPVPGLGWGLIVEQRAATALTSVWLAREIAFALLVAVVGAAMVAGAVLARRLTAPLDTLAHAVDRFTNGDADAWLPQGAPTEVTRLTSAFERMRERVMSSAAEREEAIRLRDTLFSVAAHELKTPLTSLLGQIQLLQRRAAREGTLAERDQRSLAVVADQSQRLNKLVVSLLDVSRLREGRLALDRTPLDIVALVDRVVGELQPTLEQHQLVRVGAAAPLWIVGDGLRLEQVLQNLIGNSVKYSPSGGEVTVDVRQAREQVHLLIADHGIGIPPAAIPQLFKPFYRAPNSEQEHIGGMGIGLYVVHEIISLHGGEVRVESAEGAGSTFTIVLPV